MSNRTHLIRPFNVSEADYVRMFEEDPPKHLMVVLGILNTREASPVELETQAYYLGFVQGSMHRLLREHPSLEDSLLPDGVKAFELTVAMGQLPAQLLSQLSTEQRSWLVDGFYLQVAFADTAHSTVKQLGNRVAIAMTLYDRWVCDSGSTEPADHQPLTVPEDCANVYEDIVGDVYLNRAGIWCRPLVAVRTQWLVMLRALVDRKDPADAFQQFEEHGGEYFLDYRRLAINPAPLP